MADKNRMEETAKQMEIEMLRKMGIDVVLDKEEFNRVLKANETLQKMEMDLSELSKLNSELDELKIEKQAVEELKKEFKEPDVNQKDFLNKISYAMNEEIKNLNMGLNNSAVLIATKNMMKKLNQEQREKFISVINEKNVSSIDKGLPFLAKLAKGQSTEDKSASTKPNVKKAENIEKDDDRMEV